MDFEQLKIFVHAALLRSFSGAAEKLFTSQPNVSMRIKALEEELGTALFDRSRPREVELTEAGRLFLDYAQALLNLEKEAGEKLREENPEIAGLVRLGASTVPGAYLLPAALAQFRKEQPGIEFNLMISGTASVLEKLSGYVYDLGFVGQLVPEERLEFVPVADDELVVAAPLNLLAGEGKKRPPSITLDRCLFHNLLIREKGSATRQLLETALAEKGFFLQDFAGLTRINSLEGIKQAVRCGVGISFISRRAVADYLETGLIDCFSVTGLALQRKLYLVRHKSRVLSRAAQSFWDYWIRRAGTA